MSLSNTLATAPSGVGAFDVPTLSLVSRASVRALPDDELLTLQADLAALRRAADTNIAMLADEIAQRSHPSLGHAGLAQRLGNRTPQHLVQQLVGGSARDAAALVRVGSLLGESTHDASVLAGGNDGPGGPGGAAGVADGEPAAGGATAGETDGIETTGGEITGGESTGAHPGEPPRESWLLPVAHAITESRLSVAAGDAIARGVGHPDDLVSAEILLPAVEQLVAEATVLTLEQLAARARHARATLDLDAEPSRVDEREAALRDRRYLYLSRQADGMTRLNGLLDPESAALVRSAVDAATSPRRGGPRFVSARERERAERMLRDTRTTEQLALDSLVELIRLGGEVAPVDLIGVGAPAVHVIVAERDLASRNGLGRLEGQTEPVSTSTVKRHLCANGAVPVVIDAAGDVLALGRQQRLFTRRQRIALAARDGGCRFPGCERPPSWTEAHHIVPWSQGGRTDVQDGVLLCRHHHLLLHNNGWRFARVEGALHVIPPPDIDAAQRPIPAPSKSPALERARAG